VRAMRAEGVGLRVETLATSFLQQATAGHPTTTRCAYGTTWHKRARPRRSPWESDKERPEDYLDFNDGHVLDMGETRQGKGGVDRVVEWKAYSPLVQVST
jgi:hypothetical protein